MLRVSDSFSSALLLPVERVMGDEFQVVTDSPEAALDIALAMTREEAWSVGMGVGAATLGVNTRESTGPAFFAAREAVEVAKRKQTHFELGLYRRTPDYDLAALIDLLIILRQRRSSPGWELFDLFRTGTTSGTEAARILGITAQSVSQRIRTAGLGHEARARAAILHLLGSVDS